MNEKREVLVSISCITFNHVNFIEKCLEGFLMQKCDFKYEVLIHDDASTDGTKEIIEKYHALYPDIIKPIFQKENQYSKGKRGFNAKYNFSRAKGKYIALCEGDDYWIDSSKLQKQVDLLESDSDATLSFSFARSLIISDKKEEQKFGRDFGPPSHFIKTNYYRNDFLVSNFAPTSTIVFKKETVDSLPSWHDQWHLGDWTLCLHLLSLGHAILLKEFTSIYRIHDQGIWSKIPVETKFKKQIELLKFLINLEKNKKSKKILYLNLFSQQLALSLVFLKQKRIMMFFSTFIVSLKTMMKADWNIKNLRLYIQKISVFKNYLKLHKKQS